MWSSYVSSHREYVCHQHGVGLCCLVLCCVFRKERLAREPHHLVVQPPTLSFSHDTSTSPTGNGKCPGSQTRRYRKTIQTRNNINGSTFRINSMESADQLSYLCYCRINPACLHPTICFCCIRCQRTREARVEHKSPPLVNCYCPVSCRLYPLGSEPQWVFVGCHIWIQLYL